MSTLSMEEEEAGVKAYWKEFDAALRLAAFGSKEVANPAEYIRSRGRMYSWVFRPNPSTYMWVNIGREKQAYCGDDVKKMNTEDFKEMQKKKKRADRAINDKEAAEEDEEKKEAGEDNKEAAEEAEEDNKEAAEEAEEKKEADEEDEGDMPELVDALDDALAEGEDGMKKVFMQQVLVEDPNAGDSEDEEMEHDVVKMETGGLIKDIPFTFTLNGLF